MTRRVTFESLVRWLKELREHTDQHIVLMLVGNKADLRHLRAVTTDDSKVFAERENTFFMETSALEAINVENAFSEVLSQIYRMISRRALDAGGSNPAALPKGQIINVGNKDDVSAVKQGCVELPASVKQISKSIMTLQTPHWTRYQISHLSQLQLLPNKTKEIKIGFRLVA
nr:ras-related protein RABA1f [Ipomoea batatas]